MPLCPQITNTPITVVQNSDYSVSSVIPVVLANTEQVSAVATIANAAQTSANGKNKITYSTSAASGSGTSPGDIWWQYSSGIIIAQWTWDGSSWQPNQVGSTVIANLDAGKITAGTITVALGITNPSGNFTVNASTGYLTCSGANVTGKIYSSDGEIGGFKIGLTYLSSGAGGTGFYINSSSGAASFASVASSGTISAGGTFIINAGTSTISGGSYTVNNLGAVTSASILTTGAVTANGELYGVTAGATTTTSTANTWISTGGLFRRSTASSQRYKENIADIRTIFDIDPKKLLNLPVRAFTYKEEFLSNTDDRYQMMIPGFIAEEVDAIYPIAADYENGPESWNDRMIIPGLLALIQDQEVRIKALENK